MVAQRGRGRVEERDYWMRDNHGKNASKMIK
jgi:hypothetical protein